MWFCVGTRDPNSGLLACQQTLYKLVHLPRPLSTMFFFLAGIPTTERLCEDQIVSFTFKKSHGCLYDPFNKGSMNGQCVNKKKICLLSPHKRNNYPKLEFNCHNLCLSFPKYGLNPPGCVLMRQVFITKLGSPVPFNGAHLFLDPVRTPHNAFKWLQVPAALARQLSPLFYVFPCQLMQRARARWKHSQAVDEL